MRDASPLIIIADSSVNARWVYRAWLCNKSYCLLSEVVSFGTKIGPRGLLVASGRM